VTDWTLISPSMESSSAAVLGVASVTSPAPAHQCNSRQMRPVACMPPFPPDGATAGRLADASFDSKYSDWGRKDSVGLIHSYRDQRPYLTSRKGLAKERRDP
jgi:hypothetical protein